MRREVEGISVRQGQGPEHGACADLIKMGDGKDCVGALRWSICLAALGGRHKDDFSTTQLPYIPKFTARNLAPARGTTVRVYVPQFAICANKLTISKPNN